MPKFDLSREKATNVVGKIVVLEIGEEAKKDQKTGETYYDAVIVFEGEKKNPVTVKLVKKPEGLEEYESVEIYGFILSAWAQASNNFASLNWRANAFEMVKAGKEPSKEFTEAYKHILNTPITTSTAGNTTTQGGSSRNQ